MADDAHAAEIDGAESDSDNDVSEPDDAVEEQNVTTKDVGYIPRSAYGEVGNRQDPRADRHPSPAGSGEHHERTTGEPSSAKRPSSTTSRDRASSSPPRFRASSSG